MSLVPVWGKGDPFRKAITLRKRCVAFKKAAFPLHHNLRADCKSS